MICYQLIPGIIIHLLTWNLFIHRNRGTVFNGLKVTLGFKTFFDQNDFSQEEIYPEKANIIRIQSLEEKQMTRLPDEVR